VPKYGFALVGAMEGDEETIRNIMDELMGEVLSIDNVLTPTVAYGVEPLHSEVTGVAWIRIRQVD
jgi:hypothetical protein